MVTKILVKLQAAFIAIIKSLPKTTNINIANMKFNIPKLKPPLSSLVLLHTYAHLQSFPVVRNPLYPPEIWQSLRLG